MKKTSAARVLSFFFALLLALTPVLAMARSAPQDNYQVVYNTPTLNLRQGPGTDYAVIGVLKKDEWVHVMGTYNNWYYVTAVSSGMIGYVSPKYLTDMNVSEGTSSNIGVVNNPVSTQFLNLRQYPSLDAPVLGIYFNGTPCTVLAATGSWYQVQVEGQSGYFMQQYVSLSGGVTWYVSTGNSGKLNLRSAPLYTASTVLGQYPNGTPVTVLCKGGTFWKVTVSGMTGYVDSKYLSNTAPITPVNPTATPTPYNPYYPPAETPAPLPIGPTAEPYVPKPKTSGYAIVNNPRSTQVLNLRTQPSSTAKSIAQYRNGIRMEIVYAGKNWCKVYGASSGKTGYMMTKYLRLYGVNTTFTKTVSNGSSYVNLRSAASKTAGNVLAQIPSGTAVTLLTPGDEWSQVQVNGRTGYMMTVFLK